MQCSPERIVSETPIPDDPLIIARKDRIRFAEEEQWIRRRRSSAMTALGQRAFTYDENQIQKLDALRCSDGAVIAGLPGRGKSMALAWVIDKTINDAAFEHFCNNGMPFLFGSSSALWDRFHTGIEIPDPRTLWVFIDDWGMEYREPFAVSRADEWFRIREATPGVHTWMTTNLSKEQFLSQQGLGRIVSRIQGSTDWIEFTGTDRRKSWKK